MDQGPLRAIWLYFFKGPVKQKIRSLQQCASNGRKKVYLKTVIGERKCRLCLGEVRGGEMNA